MEKQFKKLLGNRIYLELPPKEKSAVIVDENTKEALNRELLVKMSKLKIFAVGSGITDEDLSVGAIILLDPNAMAKAPIVPLNENMNVLLVSPFDIIHIW